VPAVDRIVITDIQAVGVHGVLPEELNRAQPFGIDIELEVDLARAGETDELDDTVDYGAVISAVARLVESESHRLLERLAARIAEMCKADVRVTAATVTVRKLRPPVPVLVEHVAVVVRR
jgi:7,8-dihydroneopterin aldolase/epimerase/oxygenase